MSKRCGVALVCGLALAGFAPAASAVSPPKMWPPAGGPGNVMVHIGEEHLDDLDGPRIFPKVIADTIRYRPDVVVASGDKASNGTRDLLEAWKNHMSAYDRAGIPYFAGVGNHDREALPGFPEGVSPFSPLGPYLTVFAERPYPFGDAAPPTHPSFAPRSRPASDPEGASSHYAFDWGNVRWVILDNSCFSFTTCDGSQNPPFAEGEDSYSFLTEQAADATKKGKLVFVSMHMPTQDPRPEHTEPTPGPHTMGEGSAATDNAMFEATAAESGVDGVFVAHIKGQWIYEQDDVPYYIDGGAGGEVYVGSAEEVGVDYGYWHGWRLIRVNGKQVVTDAVPVFVPGGIKAAGPGGGPLGREVQFEATGKQPTKDGPMVDALQLREPDPERPNAANLPEPARIWTSENPLVLAPVASKDDDPRRDRRSQTQSGTFRGRCPGRTRVTITSGIERASRGYQVQSRPGRIVRSILAGRSRVRAGRRTRVARVRLAQPARVLVRVERRGRVVRSVVRRCADDSVVARWDGRNSLGRKARAGRYVVRVIVRSDRAPVVRKFRVRLVRG